MPQREVSTTRNHTNPMPYTPGPVFPLPKVPTSRNPRMNPIPYYPLAMMLPPAHSASRNHANPMPYNPGTVFPLPNVYTSPHPMTNPFPYYPWTMMIPPAHSTSWHQMPSLMSHNPRIKVPLPNVPTYRNLTRNPMQYNPRNVMSLPNVPTPRNLTRHPMPYNSGTVVPQHMQPDSSTNDHKLEKPSVSYMQLTVDALLASEQGMLVLPDIYKSIMDKYEYYRIIHRNDDSWRGGIRYTLSINDCFYKVVVVVVCLNRCVCSVQVSWV